jgi:hypothetical protein
MVEAHIHVQHSTSFCSDILALWVEFFCKIFGNQPIVKHPRLIILSATFPKNVHTTVIQAIDGGSIGRQLASSWITR